MIGLSENFGGGEPKPPRSEDELVAVNADFIDQLMILMRGLGHVEGVGKVEPWPVVEIKKAIAGVVDVLMRRVQACMKIGRADIAQMDTERISALKKISDDLNDAEPVPEATIVLIQELF